MLCVIYTEKLEEIFVTRFFASRREFEQKKEGKSRRGKFFLDDDPGASQKKCPVVCPSLLLRSDEKKGAKLRYI